MSFDARQILEEFAACQRLIERRVATEEGGLEACRRAYRQRQIERGLCIWCPSPYDPAMAKSRSPMCVRHRREFSQRALRNYYKRKGLR